VLLLWWLLLSPPLLSLLLLLLLALRPSVVNDGSGNRTQQGPGEMSYIAVDVATADDDVNCNGPDALTNRRRSCCCCCCSCCISSSCPDKAFSAVAASVVSSEGVTPFVFSVSVVGGGGVGIIVVAAAGKVVHVLVVVTGLGFAAANDDFVCGVVVVVVVEVVGVDFVAAISGRAAAGVSTLNLMLEALEALELILELIF
jgi:hypothetical protein